MNSIADSLQHNTPRCRQCGYLLVQLPSNRCPECGTEFDLDVESNHNHVLTDPLRLEAIPIAEAHIAQACLERAGIASAVHAEAHGIIAHYDLPRGTLWVNREDEARARAALKELVNQANQRQPWTCSDCGEKIEAQFDVCWNCGAERVA